MLTILNRFMLPKDNTLPTSYTATKRMLQTHLSLVKEYDCCNNNCTIFRDSNYSSLAQCPICGDERFEVVTKIPQKKFKFLPVEKRSRWTFANKKTSFLMQSHTKVEEND